MRNAAVEVKNLTKIFKLPHEKYSTVKQHFVNFLNPRSFEKFKALDNISFEIGEGEFFGIIGSNGSGKSTLLKILAQIYQPTIGAVKIKGSLSPFIELGVGFNPELTARENIFLNAAILGLSKKETEDKFDEIIDFAELREFVDQKLKNFSSGMQVRLGFSIAIQAQTDILLVDEVLAVGDSNFQQKCFDTFYKLKKAGKTIVFVSHDLASIEDFCDRVLVLKNGKIKFLGEPNKAILEYMKLMTEAENSSQKQDPDEKGEVEIHNLVTTDFDNAKKEVFKFDEDIKVSFDCYSKINKPLNFGVSIHRSDGVYCFGANTIIDKIDPEKGSSKVAITFKNPALLEGSYYLVAAVFGETDKKILSFKDHEASFRILGHAKGQGVSFIEHEWEVK